jgi:hypothetical protein
MPYQDRLGRSKLRVFKDGLRFLCVILFTICCYNPLRTMLVVAAFWTLLLALLTPLLTWLGGSAVVPALLLAGGSVAVLTLFTGLVCHQLNYLLIGPRRQVGWAERKLQRLCEYKRLIVTGSLLLGASSIGLLVAGSRGAGGGSALVSGLAFGLILGATTALAGVIVRVIWAVGQKQKSLLDEVFWNPEAASPRSIPPPIPASEAKGAAPEPVGSR